MPAVVRRVVHYKDEIQPFKRLYSQLTFFNFYKKYRPGILLCTVLVARLEGYTVTFGVSCYAPRVGATSFL